MSKDKNNDILISIVIVNYKVPQCLIEALHSLRLADCYDRSEVIIVDNASGDNSREMIVSDFPDVHWIQLNTNVGFGRACNIGVSAAHGRYLLLLNPDTVVSSNTLVRAVEFMEAHPRAGLMGPKILNPDGTLQHSCRRSIPTPSVALYYFTGLSYLFPKNKRFGRYHLTYMDEDETAQVEVISGSFMFMRRELFNTIGGFDKRFFMYGEDIDLCYRISRAGHEVWYCPSIKIVHRKGKSSAKRRIRSRIDFYEAMIIFSRKYRGLQETFLPWWLMWVGVVFQAALNIGATVVRSVAGLIIDAAAVNTAIWAGLGPWSAYMGGGSLYAAAPGPALQLIAAHTAVSCVFVFMFLYNGIYSARQYSVKNLIFSGVLSSALVMSGIYFLTDYGTAGLKGFGAGLTFAVLITLLWREALPALFNGFKGAVTAPERAVIVGHDEEILRQVRVLSAKNNPVIVGIVRIVRDGENRSRLPGQIEGYPVLGDTDDLAGALSNGKADVLLIAAAQPRYSDIIDILVRYRNKGVDIRWEAMK